MPHNYNHGVEGSDRKVVVRRSILFGRIWHSFKQIFCSDKLRIHMDNSAIVLTNEVFNWTNMLSQQK